MQYQERRLAKTLLAPKPPFCDCFRRLEPTTLLAEEDVREFPPSQPAKLELVINLKTAKALGLTIPQSVLQRVDEARTHTATKGVC